MGKVIAIANQKGGVGKTTTAVNVAAALNQKGKTILLIDCDPQGNATTAFGVDKKTSGTYEVLTGALTADWVIKKTDYGDLMPSNRNLIGANIELISVEKRQYLLKKALKNIIPRYDYVIIDCPPSLELLTLNALAAADSILVPVQCEYYALEGLTDLIASVKRVQKKINPGLYLEGILLTMYDSRTKLCGDVASELRTHFPGKVYETVITRNVRLSEAPSHGMPCIYYDRNSKGSVAYNSVAEELLKRNEED